MNGNNGGAVYGGIGFCELLTVAFIILKLIGIISWSWLWVLSPTWIPLAIVLAVILLIVLAKLIVKLAKSASRKRGKKA